MEADLAGFQDDVARLGLLKLRIQKLLVQSQIFGIIFRFMLQQARWFMRPRDYTKASVLGGGVVDGDPYCACCEWFDWPILAVLMPRDTTANLCRLGKEGAVPQKLGGGYTSKNIGFRSNFMFVLHSRYPRR